MSKSGILSMGKYVMISDEGKMGLNQIEISKINTALKIDNTLVAVNPKQFLL